MLALNAAALPKIDEEFDEITEGEESSKKEKLKTKWAALEALVGDPKRIALIAADLVAHFEKRLEAMEGKAMIAGSSWEQNHRPSPLRSGCLHEPPHLRGSLRGADRAAPGVGGRDAQGGDDRQRRGRPRVAEAHRQQTAAAVLAQAELLCREWV